MKDLKTIYDGQVSFYGKAQVDESDGKLSLYSYDTLVCTIEGDGYILNYDVEDKYLFSKTTLKHIKEFLKQYYKYDVWTKKDIIKSAKNKRFE